MHEDLWVPVRMEMKEDRMKNEKYETCIHTEKVGQYAVYVTPGCPRASMIKGQLVSSKERCRKCQSWKAAKGE